MASLGSGYLYNWGIGFSGENSIPLELTGSLVNDFIGVGNTFNVAKVIEKPIVTNQVDQIKKPYAKFGFAFYNSDSKTSPLYKLEILSSFSGTQSGDFTSGSDFIGKLYITTNGGAPGVKNNRGLMSLGKTLGTGSGIYLYPQDTFISINKNNLRYKNLDTWSGDYNLFSGNEFTGYFQNNIFTRFSGVDGGAVIRDVGNTKGAANGLNVYEILYGTQNAVQSGQLVRQKILFQDLKTEYPRYETTQPTDNKTWASYDVRTGILNNSRNVFAYAFQFIDIATTRDSGVVITSGTQNNPFEYLQKLELPILTSGFDTSFSNYIGYCFSKNQCPVDTVKEEDVIECFTGSDISSNEYREFVSGVLKKYESQASQGGVDASSDLSISSGDLVDSLFTYQTGFIYFNNFITGDKINFNLYNFDYTGAYQQYHLNNNPIYPPSGFELLYPSDFSNIDQLVSKLNEKLNNANPWIWYPYECLSGEATGIYISGGVMYFEKLTGSGYESGDKNYNNIISYKSLRNYKQGFDLNFDLVDRQEYVEELYIQVFKKGFSYLIPNVVELQGISGDNWVVLDRRSGVYNNLTGLESTKIPINADPNLFLLSGLNFLNSNDITGQDFIDSETGIQEILFSGGFQTIQSFRQSLSNNAPPYCSIKTSERTINIVQPTGWPAGFNPCKSGESEDPDKKEEQAPESGQEDSPPKIELFLNVKRTGWLLEPTGKYLSCITGPDYDPYKIQFSGYRVVMRDFSGLAPTPENIYIKQMPEVYISNINLWSLESTPITAHTGKSQCLIGSKYTLDVADIVAIPFDYNFQYTIAGEDKKGIFTALNYPIVYPLRSFYITGNPVSRVNQNSPGVSNPNTTGFFDLGGSPHVSIRKLSSGSLLHLRLFNPLFLDWSKGKAAVWECSNNGINFSGFQLYNSGVSYFSGRATGDGGVGIATYTGYLPRDADQFRVSSPVTGVDYFRLSYTGWSGYYDFPNIKFIKESGKLVDNITGFINGVFTGIGFINQTFGNRYFYNPSTEEITFRTDLTNLFTGSGILSGNAVAIKDFVINQDLLIGGRLNITPEYSQVISSGIFTGVLNNVNYVQNNTTGLYLLSGYVSGTSNSGYFYFSTGVTGSGIYINEEIYPYYPFPTGYRQSSGTITIDYSKIKNFNLISINNTNVSYHTNTGVYFAPDFFHNTESLVNSINLSPTLFNCSGTQLSSSGLLLTANSLSLGADGNNILLTGNGSGVTFSANFLTGGKTFYPRLFPTTNFSGNANGVGVATGFYYVNTSGAITGNVPTFTGIRTFTGIWGLQTGQDFDFLSFLGNNFLSGTNAYFNTQQFTDETNILKVLVQYSNHLNTDENDILDVANLKINDLNFNSIFPTGTPNNTGIYNFRITGIKTL